jgi:hypothetical protein
MDQLKALKNMEGTLALQSDHISVMSSKLEDLLFRAQRIAAALKDNPKAKISDSMFGYDLQIFRRDVRTVGNDVGGLASALGSIEKAAQYDETSLGHAQAVMRFADRVHKGMCVLLDKAVLAHSHIRGAEHKVEAWYMVQEVEALSQITQVLPGIANKVILAVSTRKPGAPGLQAGAAARPAVVPFRPTAAPRPAPAAAPAPEPAASPAPPVLQRRAAVPLRPLGRLVSDPSTPPTSQQP